MAPQIAAPASKHFFIERVPDFPFSVQMLFVARGRGFGCCDVGAIPKICEPRMIPAAEARAVSVRRAVLSLGSLFVVSARRSGWEFFIPAIVDGRRPASPLVETHFRQHLRRSFDRRAADVLSCSIRRLRRATPRVAAVLRAGASLRRSIRVCHSPGDSPPMSAPTNQPTSKPVRLGAKDFSIPDAEAFCRRFANGFFWIAGLSLINMIMIATESGYAMLPGLGVTQVMQGFALATSDPGWTLMSYVVGCAVVALFVFFGWRARQIERWPFILGMSLYALDTLIFLAVRDFVALGFHLFWLLFLSIGLRAVSAIRAAKERASAPEESDAQSGPLPDFLRAGTVSSDRNSPAAPSGA